jgi:hypothetical protein
MMIVLTGRRAPLWTERTESRRPTGDHWHRPELRLDVLGVSG